jgi:hypothetical protein
MPFALHTTMLVIVIAVFEMPLGIPDTARHGPYRQHKPTLALFEFRMQQPFVTLPPWLPRQCRATHPFCPCCGQHGQNPQASFRLSPAKSVLAALVLEIDTIPKPHGLGRWMRQTNIERNSNNLGRRSMMFEFCPGHSRVLVQLGSPKRAVTWQLSQRSD